MVSAFCAGLAVVAVFILLTPLHELGHVLCFTCLGFKKNITAICWLEWRGGYVKTENLRPRGFWKNNWRFTAFLMGYSGAGLVFIVLMSIAYALYGWNENPQDSFIAHSPMFGFGLVVLCLSSEMYALYEGLQAALTAQLTWDGELIFRS